MVEKSLNPDTNQQEHRAEKSQFLAEIIEREFAGKGVSATLKGEAVDVTRNGKQLLTVTANSDETFTIDNDGKRFSSADIGAALKSRVGAN